MALQSYNIRPNSCILRMKNYSRFYGHNLCMYTRGENPERMAKDGKGWDRQKTDRKRIKTEGKSMVSSTINSMIYHFDIL